MSLVDIVKKTIESEDSIIDQIAEPDVAVYHFLYGSIIIQGLSFGNRQNIEIPVFIYKQVSSYFR